MSTKKWCVLMVGLLAGTTALLFGAMPVLADENAAAADKSNIIDEKPQDQVAESGAGKDCHDPTVLPPFPRAYGKTVGEWSAEWWQWGLSAPFDVNPIIDETGKHAHVGQSGPVWFLAGTFPGVGPVERTCVVPRGKAILIPVVNAAFWGPEDITEGEDYFEFVQNLRDQAAVLKPENVIELECRIDDLVLEREDLLKLRAKSQPFGFTAAPDFGIKGDLAVSDGYWVLLKPLKPGWHTIGFHAKIDLGGGEFFELDVTYHLRVRRWR